MAGAESTDERLDRELIELLNELRVALPGVQMLFGFLLALPFSVGFEHTSAVDRRAYFVSFLAAAAASVLLIAPSAYHRLTWRQRDKEHLLRAANVMAIAGLGCLAIAVSAAGVRRHERPLQLRRGSGDRRGGGRGDGRVLVRTADRPASPGVAG